MATVMNQNPSELISAESRAEIDKWIAKYPPECKQSAVMAALRIVQDANGGWLTTELMNNVAAYLDMPPIAVYEVATFYSMYEHKPVGRHKICLCTNVSCMINNCDSIYEHLKNRLGIGFGEVTEDDANLVQMKTGFGGKGEGRIKAGGKIMAKFCENQTVISDQDIIFCEYNHFSSSTLWKFVCTKYSWLSTSPFGFSKIESYL